MPKYTFHLIGNAHLDPVWLWDWREGLSEGISTVRSVLDMMDERPEMTFIRGESLIYQHIEDNDPATFARIRKYVKEGRWDIVGGSFIQPDTNMPATEVLVRQYLHGRRYFQSRFGVTPRIAWSADSFGHSAGMPEILSRSGMTGFAFSRPQKWVLPLPNPVFWWQSPGGGRVLACRSIRGWYHAEREDMKECLDTYLQEAATSPMHNVAIFYGLGNHGGGPSRRHLNEIDEWAAAHPEVNVVHSGLHRLFRALETEEKRFPGGRYPTHPGEMNYCLRGCYSSVAKFKFPYRKAEAEVVRAESTDSIIGARLGRKPADLTQAWESVLFNAFHDILPGSSIERAYEDQLSWLGAARHQAQRVEFNALNALATQIDTSVPRPKGDRTSRVPFLVWNPHPHTWSGPVELEASLDYRPIWAYSNKVDQVPVELIDPKGEAVPFQFIRTEHSSLPDFVWRKRVVFQATLPPMGWSVFQIGYAEKSRVIPVENPVTAKAGTIENDSYRVVAKKGADALQIFKDGKPMFKGKGFSVLNIEDPWGSWGGMNEEKESNFLSNVQEKWKITEVELLESGPERASLWVRFAGARSRIDLTFSLARNRDAVDVAARVLWDERSSRLKLAFPAGDQARFEVPGGMTERGPAGEVPGGRWVAVGESFGFASDALYNFDTEKGVFRATVVRASRYANDVKTAAHEEIWRPAVDSGELTFRFLLTTDVARLPKLAAELEKPAAVQMTTPHPGALPRSASLFSLNPENLQLTALKPAETGRGWIVRLQETKGQRTSVRGKWLGKAVQFGPVEPWSLSTFLLRPDRKGWKAEPVLASK